MVFGLLIVHKPVGPTSHDMVSAVRRGTGEKRIGHGGTLDPLAEGVLVLGLGQATRLLEYASGHDKVYEARVRLGVETDSYDSDGAILAEKPVPDDLNSLNLEAVLAGYRGNVLQTPPVYSALKVNGKAAYKRARAGETVEFASRKVTIYTLRLEALKPPWIDLYVHCSSGTYIRSLAHDIGHSLGYGAHLAGLKRVASGPFTLADAVPWPILNRAFDTDSWSECLVPPDTLLYGTPALQLSAEEAQRVAHGQPVVGQPVVAGLGRAYDSSGHFIAVVEGDTATGVWQPHKVFAQPNS